MSETRAPLTARSRCGIHGDLTGATGRCPNCDRAMRLRAVEQFVRSVGRAIAAHESINRQRRRVVDARVNWPGFGPEFDRVAAALDLLTWEQKRARVLAVADDLAARAEVDEIERRR